MTFTRVLVLAALVFTPTAVSAQQIRLKLENGRASLEASNVPVRQILSEWARVGGVKIVNAEQVTGPPVTLHLPDVSERQALDILLRSVSGYLVAGRAPGSAGASAFDRILILVASSAPRNPPPIATPQVPRYIPPRADNVPDNGVPDGNAQGGARRPVVQTLAPLVRPPVTGAPAENEPQEAQLPSTVLPATPANPFGTTIGSGVPGVIAPVPQPQQDPNRR